MILKASERRKLAAASDDELMSRFAAGSYPAFEALYKRHRDAVYRYFVRVTDPESAADGHQETWTRIIASRRKYRAKGSFRAYLFTVAHNVRVDHFRRTPREVHAEVEATGNDSPESNVSGIEIETRLKKLIASLPTSQREALIMRREAGLTIREIAAITGVTEEGVKSRLRYAMKKLRNGMQDHV